MKILDIPRSGSLGGVTSSRNRFGQYQRTRAIPVNPNTAAQQTARNRFKAESQAWRGLTDAQRTGWREYASANPVSDSLGQSNYLTGAQMFCGVNSRMLAAGYAAGVTEPPASAPEAAPVITITTAIAAGLAIAATPNPVTAANKLVWECSPQLSAGRTYNKRFMIVKLQAAAAVPALAKADVEPFVGALVAGNKLFVRCRLIAADGATSSWGSEEVTLT